MNSDISTGVFDGQGPFVGKRVSVYLKKSTDSYFVEIRELGTKYKRTMTYPRYVMCVANNRILNDTEKVVFKDRDKNNLNESNFEVVQYSFGKGIFSDYIVCGPYAGVRDGRRRVDIYKHGKYIIGMTYARYLMCVNLGEIISPEYDVDHKNGDHTDDDINNLQLLHKMDNSYKRFTHHEGGRTRSSFVIFICPICHKRIVREDCRGKREYTAGLSTHFTCSKTCAGAFRRLSYEDKQIRIAAFECGIFIKDAKIPNKYKSNESMKYIMCDNKITPYTASAEYVYSTSVGLTPYEFDQIS